MGKLIDHRYDAADIIPAIVWDTIVNTTDGHRMDEFMSVFNATLKPFIARVYVSFSSEREALSRTTWMTGAESPPSMTRLAIGCHLECLEADSRACLTTFSNMIQLARRALAILSDSRAKCARRSLADGGRSCAVSWGGALSQFAVNSGRT